MRARTAFLLALLVGMAGLTVADPGPVAASGVPSYAAQRLASAESMKATLSRHRHSHVCSKPSALHASCNAVIDLDVSGGISANVTPDGDPWGFGPAALQSAYNLPSSTGGTGQTVAIVDAYDLPTAEADLATYRTMYGLPACTSASGCFRKVNQDGGSTPPVTDAGWGQEIALDLDMVSAACPKCSILLVEANDSGMYNLGTAENTAVALGATAVSNSWGGGEWSSESAADSVFFDHPGVAITVSAGDSGYGLEYPAASPNVIAVGGTSLSVASNPRGYSESVWSGTGSGCSVYEAKPSWQTDTGCANRSVVDVSADADPATGVAVYDSTAAGGQSGWMVFGGTSAAAPLVAGAYELAGVTSPADVPAQTLYTNPGSFFDVATGSNGTCAVTYLCTGGIGYDGPTGLGTPHGVSGFGTTPPVVPVSPDAPTRVSGVAGDGRATVSWQVPAIDGGSPITGYVVTPSVRGVAQPARTFATTATSELITGLANGTAYTFTVAAVNAAGTGAASTASGAVSPFDALTAKYAQLGGLSVLGAPSAAEAFLPGGGRSLAYAGGTIYWAATTGAHVVRGNILVKYKAIGATASILGYPTADDAASTDKVGRLSHFARGAIYWSPKSGAHEVLGAIQAKWVAVGSERSGLGYPTTDETITPDKVGRYNHFTYGSIYWTPTLGAHYVLGAIQAKWASLGWERSRLGYPRSDEFGIPGGRRSNFQHGYITRNLKTGAIAVVYTA
ncbi:MAG TPA: fibronectin type III domain-containing protein [Frankiaceae bacterium]|nr:fibronectin type III domain-containing protein [Frankiaceae bacterium]